MEKFYLKDIFYSPISGEWGQELDIEELGSPVIRTTNFLNDGQINFDEIVYRNIDLTKKKNKLLKKGDIIIEKSGGTPTTPVGRVVYFESDEDKFFTNNFTATLRIKDDINSKYIFYMMYYFHKIRVVLKYQNKTTGIINLKLGDYLKNTKVNIPERNIQNKTVNKLDKLKTLIQTRKDQIQALDDLVESVFYEILNENEQTFVYINDVIEKKPKNLSNKDTDPISYFDISSIDNQINKFTNENIILDSYDRPSRAKQIIESGDILLSTVRPNLKNIAYFNYDYTYNPIASTGFAVLRAKTDIINPMYLFQMVVSNEFTNSLMSIASGASYPAVKESDVRKLKVPLIPLDQQNKFASLVKKIEGQKEILNSSLDELTDLFDSLMQDAFDGSLIK